MMWELYDELLAGIPEGLHVKRMVAGNFWTVVESELGVGVAGTARTVTCPPLRRKGIIGESLKEISSLAKSWNLVEASIGVAAMNAYYNTPEIATNNGVLFAEGDDRLNDPYIAYRRIVRGKKVACIGSHSAMVDSLLKDVAEVSLLGEDSGEFPLSAADYLLPEQDLVYLPCSSEITKELPRFLHLSRNGVAIICGPSVTMSPVLFKYGAFDMAGLVVTDSEKAFASGCGTDIMLMFAAGKKASLRRDDIKNL